MDSFELNKIIGAVLGTLLFVMGTGFLAEAIYHPIEDNGPGYSLPEPEGATEGATEEAAEPEVPLGMLLADASAENGAKAIRKCQSCHNFGQGEANKTGPGLYDVVERPIAGHEGFAYSPALAELGGAGETWTYEHLDDFLTSPKDFAPGTKMSFAGVKAPEERADILAYLATLSGSPKPFPAREAPGADPQAPVVEAAPSQVIESNETAPTESPVVGTPTGSGTPASTAEDVPPPQPATADQPAAPAEANPTGAPAPTGEGATEAPITEDPATTPAPAPAATPPAN